MKIDGRTKVRNEEEPQEFREPSQISDDLENFEESNEEDEDGEDVDDPIQDTQFREDAWDLFEHLDQDYDSYLRYEELEPL